MLSFVKDRITAGNTDEHGDSADLVQTVILIAGFAIVAILVVVWIGTAIKNQGAGAARCIDNSSGVNSAAQQSACNDTAKNVKNTDAEARRLN